MNAFVAGIACAALDATQNCAIGRKEVDGLCIWDGRMVQLVSVFVFSVAQNAADLGYIARFDHENEERVVFVLSEAPF